VLALVSDPQHSDEDWVGGGGQVPRVRGLPLLKPPYSRVTAINLNTGDRVWMVPNGDTPPAIKANPALAGLTIPPTGAQSRPEILATRTLLFVGEGSGAQPILHVLDKATGATLANIDMPGSIGSVPMTYTAGGRQFVACWTSDRRAGQPAELVALAIGGAGRGGRGGGR
jgi:glucose dehydrogenase